MKARAAARELALISFTWLSKEIDKLSEIPLEEIVINSVRTLKNHAENELQLTLSNLIEIREYIQQYEIEHPENLKKPVDSMIKPVKIPLTSDMLGRIDTLIDVADKSFNVLELSELYSLTESKIVKSHIERILQSFLAHKDNVDEQIANNSKGWGIDRLVKIDRDILRIAITELLYFEDIPVAVTIDEAVELAKKYSTEESSAFINGILREVVKCNNIVKAKTKNSKKQDKQN